MIRNKKGFTLVELLAVIVILAIILVIAVPQIIKTIDSAREGAFSASAKLIATTAEKEYLARKTIGDTSFEGLDTIPCTDVVKENTNDYQSCDISFDENGKATVTLIGKGKFAGKYVCNGNKTSAEVTEESCTLVALTVDANGGTNTVEYNAKYEASSTVPLTIPTAPEGKEFDKWEVSGTGASVTNNTLTMGTTATTVKAIWKVKVSFTSDEWSTIIAAVQAAETNETDYPYNVGDTKTIQMELDSTVDGPENYTLRVANTTKCSDDWMADEQKSQTACGFVLEFAQAITTVQMNDTATNAGGWPESAMRTYLNDTTTGIYSKIPATLRDAIINTNVVSGHGKDDTTGTLNNYNFGSTDKLYLLSTYEVWGSDAGNDSAATNTITRQLDYYKDVAQVTISNYRGAAKKNAHDSASSWWLRSAYSSDEDAFYVVNAIGYWGCNAATSTIRFSPAFRIGNAS